MEEVRRRLTASRVVQEVLHLVRTGRVWTLSWLLLMYPPAVRRLSPHRFPSLGNRLTKTPNPFDDFDLVVSRSSEMRLAETATLVMRGKSFDVVRLKALRRPLYLVNWPNHVDGDEVCYATADRRWLVRYLENGMSPILYVENWWMDLDGRVHVVEFPELDQALADPRNRRIAIRYRSKVAKSPSLGSGLSCVVALSKIARRLDVWGWDDYWSGPPSRMTLWQLTSDLTRTHPWIDQSLYNLHYAHRLSAVSAVRLEGALGDLGRRRGLADGLDQVFYAG